jgi:KaiC/GvpD/RAD55 family RecA-like ATPase
MSSAQQACTFGVPLLDQALGGGVPRGSVILIENEVGVGHDHLLMRFLAEGLRQGEYGYILSTEHLYEHYKSLLIPHGIDEIVFETRRLVFIDAFSNPYGYSDLRGPSLQSESNIIQDISQPRQISDSIRRALLHVRSRAVRGVVDSLSTLILVSDDLKPPLSFLQNKIATDKEMGYTSLLTIHKDVHPPHVTNVVEHYVDGVIEISRLKDASHRSTVELRVKKMLGLTPSELDQAVFLFKPRPGAVELESVEQ